MDLIFEFFLELLIELFGGSLVKLIERIIGRPIDFRPFQNILVYMAAGFLFGLVSVVVHGEHIIKNKELRLLHLFVGPMILGGVMWYRGKYLRKKDRKSVV